MSEIELKAIRCAFIIDGFHIRAGYKNRFKIWPNTDQISTIIDNIIVGVSEKVFEWTGIETTLSRWIYCDALLSQADERQIEAFVNEQASLPLGVTPRKLEFNLSRYVEARAIFSEIENQSFNQNAVIKNLEVKRGNWIRFPPRQSGVDTVIATEMIAASRENDMIVVVSSDSGFAYTVHRIRDMEFYLPIGNVNYKQAGTGEILRSSCSVYFLVDEDGTVVDADCEAEAKFDSGYLRIWPQE